MICYTSKILTSLSLIHTFDKNLITIVAQINIYPSKTICMAFNGQHCPAPGLNLKISGSYHRSSIILTTMRVFKFAISLLLIIAGANSLLAQNGTSAAGGEATGSDGSVSYSVGQVFFQSVSDMDGSVSSGIQQAYVISEVPGTWTTDDIQLKVSIYPNPVSDYLLLRLDQSVTGDLEYHLLDMNGKSQIRAKITGNESIIPVGQLSPSVYILKITSYDNELKVFKIIKH